MKSLPVVALCAIIAAQSIAGIAHSEPLPEIVNGNFSLGDIDGVACEWFFEGTGSARVESESQIVRGIVPGAEASFYQEIPHCAPGAGYRLTAQLDWIDGDGAQAWLGIAPSIFSSVDDFVWRPFGSVGPMSVEINATDSAIAVYIAVANPQGADSASASFSDVILDITGGGQPTVQRDEPPTRPEYHAGVDLLRRIRREDARAILSEIVQELPDSRPDASMALIRLQEVAKLDEWKTAGKTRREKDTMLGIQNLREALLLYPEQTHASSLARCKLGEHYLARMNFPMAHYQLSRTLRDFPGSEGSVWAKNALINLHMWTGKTDQAEQIFNEIKDLHVQGHATDEQLGWAEHHFVAQRLAHEGKHDEYMAKLEELSLKYRETAPEVAARCKTWRYFQLMGDNPTYLKVKELREAIERHPDVPHIIDGLKYKLMSSLISRGWKQEHQAEAHRLYEEIMTRPDAIPEHTEPTQQLYNDSLPRKVWEPKRARTGTEAIRNPLFLNSAAIYLDWVIYGSQPNWQECDWFGQREYLHAAWNTINCGTPATLDVCCIQKNIVSDASASFMLTADICSEGILGADLSDTSYEVSILFKNPFQEPLVEFTSGRIPVHGEPKRPQRIEVTGVSPEDGYLADVSILFTSRGSGHRAIAFDRASLIFLEDDND